MIRKFIKSFVAVTLSSVLTAAAFGAETRLSGYWQQPLPEMTAPLPEYTVIWTYVPSEHYVETIPALPPEAHVPNFVLRELPSLSEYRERREREMSIPEIAVPLIHTPRGDFRPVTLRPE